MTPKEEAKELFRKFYILDHKIWQDTAKQCALITVDKMINYLNLNGFSTQIEYWNEVKQEINDL